MISLISHTGKVLLIVLLIRLKKQLEHHPLEEQAEFRKGRRTIHKVVALRLTAKKTKRQGKKTCNCFTDAQEAFDTVKHKIIWAVLRSYGVEEKMVTLLQKIYEITQLAVRIRKMQGVWFPIDIGTRQGDPLSPLLFIVYLERVMDHLKESECGININGIILNNLRYVDDIDLIDEECSSAEKQFETTRIAA